MEDATHGVGWGDVIILQKWKTRRMGRGGVMLTFLHRACNHAKGICVKNIRKGQCSALKAHTGAVDSVWKLVKDAVPPSLATLTCKTWAAGGLCSSAAMATCD